MIRRMVEYMLGPLGMQVLAFYTEHSLIINGVVVLYGLVLTLAHLNLRRIEAAALQALQTEAGGKSSGGPEVHASGKRRPNAGMGPAVVPWEAVIAQASFFPLVAHGTSLVPRRARPDALEALCPSPRLHKKLARGGDGGGEAET